MSFPSWLKWEDGEYAPILPVGKDNRAPVYGLKSWLKMLAGFLFLLPVLFYCSVRVCWQDFWSWFHGRKGF